MAKTLRPSRETALSLLVAGTFFMENLDATVIAPALPSIARSFQVEPVDLGAAMSVYMLALGLGIPLSGWLAERLGARRVFASAIVIFTLASALCGLAQNLPSFVIARILQGLGGAMMVPVGRLAVLKSTLKADLVRTIAILTWPALLAPVLGPPIGGLFVKLVDWRWIFFLNLPLGIIAFVCALGLVPDLRAEGKRPLDLFGYALLGSGLAIGLWTAESMGAREAGVGKLLVMALVSAVFLTFAFRRMQRHPNPLLSLSALKSQAFSTAIFGGALFRTGVSAIPFLLPLLLQTRFGFDPLEAGLMLMFVFAGNILAKPMTTWIMRTVRGSGERATAFFPSHSPSWPWSLS